MKISVSVPMILFGARCDSFECPIARAFKAHGFDVMVAADHVDFYDFEGECCATLALPASAQRFQRQFDDNRLQAQPFEFEMPGLEPGVLPFSHFTSAPVV